MANFSESEKITGGNEGGLSDSKQDRGGFTYAGIASKFWPNWKGWPIVRGTLQKCNNDFERANLSLKANTEVQRLVSDFYKANFWDVNKLDLINDQQIANTVYDMGVNSGTGTAAKMLQVAAKVKVDSVVGSDTIHAVNASNPVTVYNSINEQRIAYYTHIAKEPGQAQFLKGWLSRIKPYSYTTK
jgi:lysozyme family protein